MLPTTTRLILRPHTMDNLTQLHAWFNDIELTYFDGEEQEVFEAESLEKTEEVLQRILQPSQKTVHYAIHRRMDGRFIGYGQIAHVDVYNRRCLLGITIGEKAQWGKGYAREALAAVIDWCFSELDLNHVGAAIYDFSQRSLRLFEGLGFRREGTLRQHILQEGSFADEHLYSLLRFEWEELCQYKEGKAQKP